VDHQESRSKGFQWDEVLKQKFIDAYMDTAKRFAELSHAKRLQVGAIVVKDDRIISIGYNGMPTGWDNCCEENGKTKPEVLHAEANALTKLAKSTESGDGASLFCTHSPCIDCAKLIAQSGIAHVYYDENYRSEEGLKFLVRSGVLIHNVK
jgi:dCMP deaminase